MNNYEGLFLNDKKCFLYYDGFVHSDDPNVIIDLLETGIPSSKLICPSSSPDLNRFNKLVPKSEQIKTNHTIDSLDFAWILPQPYNTFNVEEYIRQRMVEHNGEESEKIKRVEQELTYFKSCNMINLLRAVYYIVDVFKQNNIVWGIGRGSSISSYVLFLLELHDIDPIKFELDIEDFLPISKTINTQQC